MTLPPTTIVTSVVLLCLGCSPQGRQFSFDVVNRSGTLCNDVKLEWNGNKLTVGALGYVGNRGYGDLEPPLPQEVKVLRSDEHGVQTETVAKVEDYDSAKGKRLVIVVVFHPKNVVKARLFASDADAQQRAFVRNGVADYMVLINNKTNKKVSASVHSAELCIASSTLDPSRSKMTRDLPFRLSNLVSLKVSHDETSVTHKLDIAKIVAEDLEGKVICFTIEIDGTASASVVRWSEIKDNQRPELWNNKQ